MSKKVSIVRFNGNLSHSLGLGLSFISGLRIPKLPILIKPNLCAESDPTGAATTGIPFVKAIIDTILKEDEDAVIKIVESDSSGKRIKRAFKNLGYTRMERSYRENGYDVSLVNLSDEPLTTIPLGGLYFKRVRLPTILTQPKLFISLANAKTHSLTQMTGALKNQFGCLPEKDKARYHRFIEEVIVDVNSVVRPDLCLIDAVFGLEGMFKGGKRKVGVIICGRDPVAVDSVLARVMGFNPSRIRHLVLAERHGLGSLSPEVVGEKVESVMVRFRREYDLIATLGKYVPHSLMPLARRVYYIFK